MFIKITLFFGIGRYYFLSRKILMRATYWYNNTRHDETASIKCFAIFHENFIALSIYDNFDGRGVAVPHIASDTTRISGSRWFRNYFHWCTVRFNDAGHALFTYFWLIIHATHLIRCFLPQKRVEIYFRELHLHGRAASFSSIFLISSLIGRS